LIHRHFINAWFTAFSVPFCLVIFGFIDFEAVGDSFCVFIAY